MSRPQEAVRLFAEGYNCAQAILGTYGQQYGLDRQTALKLAAGFGGGMGRMAETCGAVSAAFMVLGLRYGSSAAEATEAKQTLYGLVRQFAARFRQRRGSILCRELLGCDLSSPEGLQRARQEGLFARVCSGLVQEAAELLEGLL
ncbi:MAG: C-GCAxxG-C-C family protein [Thermoguttaceae bacterium]